MTRKAGLKAKLNAKRPQIKTKLKSSRLLRFALALVIVLGVAAPAYIVIDQTFFKDDKSSAESSSEAPNQDNAQDVEVTRPEIGTDGLPDPCLLIDETYLSNQLEDNGTFDQGKRSKKVSYKGEARCVFTSDAGNTATISVIKDDDKSAWKDLLEHYPDARDTGTRSDNFDDIWNPVDSDLMMRRGNLTFWLQFSFASLDTTVNVMETIGANIQGLIDRGEMDAPDSPNLDVETGQ